MKKILFVLLITACFVVLLQQWKPLAEKIQEKEGPAEKPFEEISQLLDRDYKIITVSFPKKSDPSKQIQKALNLAKNSKIPIKVIIPEGSYTLKKALHIYSNTWLYTSPNTVFRKANTHKEIMLLNGDFKVSYKGYDGNSNIIVDGGIWDAAGKDKVWTPSVFGFAHGRNILIQNTVIKNIVGGHAIDSAGNKDVIIKNNKFLGFYGSGNEPYIEAIQIDGMISEKAFRRFGTVDFTVTKNIRIEDNYFGNSHVKGMKPWGVGVGSHSTALANPYSNIQILNNTFEGMTYAAVRGHNWENTLVKGNRFIDCALGVRIDKFGSYYTVDGKHHITNGKFITSQFKVESNVFIETDKKPK
ncbi:hypothetical protein OH784_21915 [Ectobacillus funiculus]|uniref:hypothetical protein n=1 Tax=Ectobacillus funiculus TaxID=137993 RepID=UPI0039798F91